MQSHEMFSVYVSQHFEELICKIRKFTKKVVQFYLLALFQIS